MARYFDYAIFLEEECGNLSVDVALGYASAEAAILGHFYGLLSTGEYDSGAIQQLGTDDQCRAYPYRRFRVTETPWAGLQVTWAEQQQDTTGDGE